MTNAACAIGVTYRGTDVQEDPPGILLTVVGSPYAGLEVRGTDYLVPTEPGLYALNRVATRRILALEGFVMGSGANEDAAREDFAILRALFHGVFNPRLDPDALVLALEDGTQITADYRTLPDIVWNQVGPSFAMVGVRLETVTPEWSVVTS
jgi:hypothetical protein